MRSLLTRGGEDGGSNTIEPNRHGFSLRPTGLNCHLVKAEPDVNAKVELRRGQIRQAGNQMAVKKGEIL